MVQFQKAPQGGETWLLLNNAGERLGRIWVGAHIDRILRDGDLAEAIAAVMNQTGSARRQAARQALDAWTAAGGRSVDFANLSVSLENPPGSGNMDGKRHIFWGAAHVGYLDIPEPPDGRHARLARFVRLAEELFAAEALGTSAQRNAALDAAITRFRDGGGLADQ